MSIWHTQAVYDVAVGALAGYPGADAATHALVEVRVATDRPPYTTAALLTRSATNWDVTRLYTADHEIPGAVAVVVIGVW